MSRTQLSHEGEASSMLLILTPLREAWSIVSRTSLKQQQQHSETNNIGDLIQVNFSIH